MKKVLAICLLLTTGFSASAQSNVSLGLTGGGNYSCVKDPDVHYPYKPGFNGGAVLTWGPVEHWGFGGALLYSLEGYAFEGMLSEAHVESITDLAYLRMPLRVSYFFLSYQDRVRPKIFLGPSPGFLISAVTNTEMHNNGSTTRTRTVTTDSYQRFDLGIQAGAGCNIRLTENGIWMNIDAAYTHGLLDISASDYEHYNRNLSLNLGVTFPFGYVKPPEETR
jgi:hypothetical protein